MSSEDILNPEEVDFLLGGSEGAKEISFLSSEVQEVTMRGDLEHMGLPDIFQTLSMSKMEGVLRIRNPLETREVYFCDGRCRCAPPARVETRRIGQFLIRAGYITPEQLRGALVEQKQRRVPVGRILVEKGLVPAEDLEELAISQFTEDIFSLFTWQRGVFEFYKGAIIDDVLRARMERLPEFEVGTLLLEVARRTDEWSGILDTLGKLEEIPTGSALDAGMDELPLEQVHHTVLEVINGRMTFRDLGDATMLGLFATARAARDLFQWGVLELLPSAELLQVAAEWVREGDHKRAVATIQTLYERQELLRCEDIRAMADILRESGEGRLAGGLLLEHAQSQDDSELALELVRHARVLSPRDIEVLTELDVLLRSDPVHIEEHRSVLLELVDCCLADHALDAAADHIGHLEELGAPAELVLGRRAQVYTRQKDVEGAIAAYDELVAIYQQDGNRKRLGEVYERILKLDHNRRDIARALKALHTSRGTRIRRAAIIAAGVAAVLYFGWNHWQQLAMQDAVAAADAQVRGLVHTNDLEGANRALAAAIGEWGDPRPFEEVRQVIDLARTSRESSEARAARTAYQESLANAATLLEKGDLREALAVYLGLVEGDVAHRKQVIEIVKVRLDALQTQFVDLTRTLPHKLPPSPTATTPRSKIQSALATLKGNFSESLLATVDGVLELEEEPALEVLVGAEHAAELLQVATGLRELVGRSSVLLAQYEEAAETANVNSQLNPVFLAARDHEKHHRFEEARAAYDTLAHSDLRDESLRAHFVERFEHYKMVTDHMRVLSQAADAGNFDVAVSHLRSLQSKVPDVPFSTMVALPLSVSSQPPAAEVVVDGEAVGRTPMTVHYTPGVETQIEVKLQGFVSEKLVVTGDTTREFASFLARTPAWVAQTRGAIDRAVAVAPSGVAFVVDRSGSCTAVATNRGEELWTLGTEDLSGFLSRPALAERTLVLTSIDGPVRCVDQATGEVLWTTANLPSRVGAVTSRGCVVVATDRTLVGLALGSGTELWRRQLSSPIGADLTLVGPHVLASGHGGELILVQADIGETVWHSRGGRGITSSPLATPAGIVVVAEDGSITLLDNGTGDILWQRQDMGELPHAPVASGRQVFLTRHEGVLALNLDTGETVATLERRGLCSPPTLANNRLLAAVSDGNVLVVDPSTLSILYRLKTGDRALTTAAVDSEGRVMVTTESGRLLGFLRLP